MRFLDRLDAGRLLAMRLVQYTKRNDVIVVSLPRGGVPIGWEIAKNLHVQFDILIVRKLGVPGMNELAMGAIASGGFRVLNEQVVQHLHLQEHDIEQVTQMELRELMRREHLYRGDRPPLSVSGRTVILVDDGLATGATMRVAIKATRRHSPAKIIVAVPVGARQTCEELRSKADQVVCVEEPDDLVSVGSWYRDFDQITDGEVRQILIQAHTPHPDSA